MSTARQHARVLVADISATRRRRLARMVLAGGFEVLTAPDRAAVGALLRTTRVDAALLTVGLAGGSEGLDELLVADPHLQIVLGAAPKDTELTVAIALGRCCLPVQLPIINEHWLHLLLDRAVAHRRLLERAGRLETFVASSEPTARK